MNRAEKKELEARVRDEIAVWNRRLEELQREAEGEGEVTWESSWRSASGPGRLGGFAIVGLAWLVSSLPDRWV